MPEAKQKRKTAHRLTTSEHTAVQLWLAANVDTYRPSTGRHKTMVAVARLISDELRAILRENINATQVKTDYEAACQLWPEKKLGGWVPGRDPAQLAREKELARKEKEQRRQRLNTENWPTKFVIDFLDLQMQMYDALNAVLATLDHPAVPRQLAYKAENLREYMRILLSEQEDEKYSNGQGNLFDDQEEDADE